MVGVAQWLEHQVVALGAEGSSPFIHPPVFFHYKKSRCFMHRLFCLLVTGESKVSFLQLCLTLKPARGTRLLLVRLRRFLLMAPGWRSLNRRMCFGL